MTDDTVTARLNKPEEQRDKPLRTAVLGDSVLVCYGDNLVVYKTGVSSQGTMVRYPYGLNSVWGMSSDGVSRFLICDLERNYVFTLDFSGNVCDTIMIMMMFICSDIMPDNDNRALDCAVVDGKLWVGCLNGNVILLS